MDEPCIVMIKFKPVILRLASMNLQHSSTVQIVPELIDIQHYEGDVAMNDEVVVIQFDQRTLSLIADQYIKRRNQPNTVQSLISFTERQAMIIDDQKQSGEVVVDQKQDPFKLTLPWQFKFVESMQVADFNIEQYSQRSRINESKDSPRIDMSTNDGQEDLRAENTILKKRLVGQIQKNRELSAENKRNRKYEDLYHKLHDYVYELQSKSQQPEDE